MLIAVTGKGGVGKTTVSSIIIRQLLKNDMKPVLAIDADPNSCLDAALGLKAEKTLGAAREEAKEVASKGMGAGISKTDLLQMKVAESLVEASGFDLVSMGRPEGAGCYCYANNVLKNVITEITNDYNYVVLDNEAGLENLSRRIVLNVDMLMLVSDPSNSGLETLKRLYSLANEMEIKYEKLIMVVNRARCGITDRVEATADAIGANYVLTLPQDTQIASFAEGAKSFLELPNDNAVVKLLDNFVKGYIKRT
jgi:CO dehydrogenase maturation factor